MINQVNGNNVSGMNFQRFGEPKALSAEQKSTLETIIEKYDPAQMTEKDYMSLGESMREAGIAPSFEVRAFIEEAGFNPPAKAHGKGGPGGPQGMRPPQQMQDEFIAQLSDIMKETSITSDQIDEVINYVKENGLFYGGKFS